MKLAIAIALAAALAAPAAALSTSACDVTGITYQSPEAGRLTVRFWDGLFGGGGERLAAVSQ